MQNENIIAGALFDLMGFLTTRSERIVLSTADNAGPAITALRQFAANRDLSLDDADVPNWRAKMDASAAAPVTPSANAGPLPPLPKASLSTDMHIDGKGHPAFSAEDVTDHARAAWNMGLNYGLQHAPAPKLPSTPAEVIAFIGPHFASLDIEGPLEDSYIRLSVHDLLSAFSVLAESAPAPAPAVADIGLPALRDLLKAAELSGQSINLSPAAAGALYRAPVTPPAVPSKPTDISTRLRDLACRLVTPANCADAMLSAADEIERYYGGMLAWKQTAEVKDRVAAPQSAPVEAASQNWPTEKMIQAGCLSQQTNQTYATYAEWLDSHSTGISERIRGMLTADFKAMLAAAPQPEAGSAGVVQEPTIWIDASAAPHEDQGPLVGSNRQIVLIGSTEGPFGSYTTPLFTMLQGAKP